MNVVKKSSEISGLQQALGTRLSGLLFLHQFDEETQM